MPESSTMKRHKYAMWAFVLGVVSIVMPLLLPCAIVALVLGSIAMHQVNKDPEHLSGKGFAIVGVATAGTSIFFGLPMQIAILIPLIVNSDFDNGPEVEKIHVEIKYMQPADARDDSNLSCYPSWPLSHNNDV
ncbi:MAG: DUF4190 domain-containing protein [Planctomycetes bacterium]|nr:DUF4190 domain-containing protein [Planctomycetota bacterium]